MTPEVTAALIVSGLAFLGTLVTLAVSAKKNEVEVLRGIIAELKNYVEDLEADKEDLQAWAERLVTQVTDAGLEPVKFIRKKRPRKNDPG